MKEDNSLYIVKEYNTDTCRFDIIACNNPMDKDTADKHIADLRRWAKEDRSGKKYRMQKGKLLPR